MVVGVPQSVHDHRPGQPVGAVEHDGVDRAARRLDRRLHRATCATRRFDTHRADRGGRGRLGPARQRLRPTSRCIRRPTRGTWAPTFPASRGCSCRTSAASTATERSCDEVVAAAATSASSGAARRASSATTVSSAAVQPDVAIVLELMAGLGLPPHGDDVGRRRPGLLRGHGPAATDRTRGRRGRRRHAARRRRRPRLPPVPAVVRWPAPVVVYYHGGGWVLGSQESDDPFCRDLCVRADAVIVSVDYRHAPEARFPAAADDAFAALQMGRRPRRRARRRAGPARRWPGGAPAEISPPSCASSPATPVARRSSASCSSRRSPRRLISTAVVPRERRRLRADDGADAVVLGPLRRPGRSRQTPWRRRCGPRTCRACRRRSS